MSASSTNTRTGELPVSLNNSYLFRSLIQRNACVRNSLISAIRGVGPDTIKNTRILNPVIPGLPLSPGHEPLEILVSYQGGGTEKIRLDALHPAMIDLFLPENHQTLLTENLWIRFSRAQTWEEMEMIPESNALIGSARETLLELLSDPAVLQQCYNCQRRKPWQIPS